MPLRSSHPAPLHPWPAAPDVSAGDFLRRHHARRLPAGHGDAPQVLGAPAEAADPRRFVWDWERSPTRWEPLDVAPLGEAEAAWWRAARLIVSGEAGRAAVCLRDAAGASVPLWLSQIAALSLSPRDEEAHAARIERAVALAADRFAWDAVEEWSASLRAHGFGLLIVPPDPSLASDTAPGAPPPAPPPFAEAARAAHARAQEEALRLEREVLRAVAAASHDAPRIVRGPLVERRGASGPEQAMVAVCAPRPLLPPPIPAEWSPSGVEAPSAPASIAPASVPPQIQRVLEGLKPGQRTPAWLCDQAPCPLACWFARGHEPQAGAPDEDFLSARGIVRVEVRREFWAAHAAGEAGFVVADRVTRGILEWQAQKWHGLSPTAHGARRLREMLAGREALEEQFARACGL